MIVEIVLGLFVLTEGYVIWNLTRKTELLETWVEDFTQTIETVQTDLEEIDTKGSFKVDDEVGTIFEQIKETEGTSMQAGAAMAVVGWWTGYKLGGVIALNAAQYFQNAGIENYWQTTFLVLGIIIIACNIGLMFVHEPQPTERQMAQRQTDQMIEEKLGSSGGITKIIAWISGTIGGPIISFFKRNGLAIALGILGFVFLFKIERLF